MKIPSNIKNFFLGIYYRILRKEIFQVLIFEKDGIGKPHYFTSYRRAKSFLMLEMSKEKISAFSITQYYLNSNLRPKIIVNLKVTQIE